MDDYYVGIGFGNLGIESAQCIRAILSGSILGHEPSTENDWDAPGFIVTIPDDEIDTPIIGRYTLEDLDSARKPNLLLLMLVDQSDPMAVMEAAAMGARAKESDVYLSMAVCINPIVAGMGTRYKEYSAVTELRRVVDSMVFVESPESDMNETEPSTRVALALISALLPKVVNLICCDLADMKQALHGHVVASLAYLSLTYLQDEELPANVADHLNIKAGRGALAQGMFYAYGAPPNDFRLVDFESVMGETRDIVEAAYHNADALYVVAALLDYSLTGSAEIITCVSLG